MNFSSIPASSRFGLMLRWPLSLIPRSTVVRILQGPLRGKKWIVGSSDHGCWLGSYESEKQSQFFAYMRPGNIVWDLGAHVGFYTLLASGRVGPQGRVVSFEPFRDNLVHLRKYLEINKCENVSVFDVAVADEDKLAYFMKGISSTTGAIAGNGEVPVKMVSLDRLWKEGAIPQPDLIKIDIEGAEYRALKGARELLKLCSPVIFLATHGRIVHEQCCDFLTQQGYELRSLVKNKLMLEADELIAVPVKPGTSTCEAGRF